MKIWIAKPDSNNYSSLVRVNTDVSSVFFQGQSVKNEWKVKEFKKDNKLIPLGDFPGSVVLPSMSEVAVKKLYPLIKDDVELLEIMVDKEKFFFINIVSVLDAIDYKNSTYKTFSDGRIYRFTNYSFIENRIKNHNIFKIIDKKTSLFPFVSDEFVKTVKNEKLNGFEFELIWDSGE